MGIKNLHKALKENFPDAFLEKWQMHVDNLFIDLNVVLHKISYDCTSLDQIYDGLAKYLGYLISKFMPLKSVVMCADGPAPLAKMLTQQYRRQNMDSIILNFSPSTIFMETLHERMSSYLTFLHHIYKINITADIIGPGEAELKIKKLVMDKQDDVNVIITNDADVILMMMTLDNPECAYLFDKQLISIGNLASHFKHKLDFTLVNMMLGNDYFPQIRAMTYDKIWKAYKQTLKVLNTSLVIKTAPLTINSEFLTDMLVKVVFATQKRFIEYDMNKDKYYNYLDGLVWCLNKYASGVCVRYDYFFNFSNVHMYGVILYSNSDYIIHKTFPPLDGALYAMLILPPKLIKKFINKKYHQFVDDMSEKKILSKCLTPDNLSQVCNLFNDYVSQLE